MFVDEKRGLSEGGSPRCNRRWAIGFRPGNERSQNGTAAASVVLLISAVLVMVVGRCFLDQERGMA
jgi:hypothetical protein